MIRDSIAYLFDLNDVPLFAFSDNVFWETEDLSDSTNQLILTVPIAEGSGVKTDQDVYFRGRKYTISEIERSKNDKDIVLICDEIQARLSDVNNPNFTIKDMNLKAAAEKALVRTDWTVKFTAEDSRTYNSELLNKSAMFCLRFLENQSGTRLIFDSVKKEISFIKDQEVIFDGVFRYGLNISNITKNETQPQATVLYPFGRDGMTIEAFTGGKKYIENFDWYISLGMTLAQARAKYTKESVWEDERYIYPGNLYRDANTKLAGMSQPQINYKLDNPEPSLKEITNSTFVYVQDEEFGLKIKTKVGRVKRSKDPSYDQIELNYIPPSFGSSDSDFTGDSTGRDNETSFFVVKNESTKTITDTPNPILDTSITVYSPTAFEMGLAAMIEITVAGTLEGYFLLDGNRMPTEIKQTVAKGWHTIGLPFVATGILEGTKTLYLYMKMTSGAAKIDVQRCELYVKAQGVYGGATNSRPDQTVIENVEVIGIPIKSIPDDATVKMINAAETKANETMREIKIPVKTIAENVKITFI